MSKPCLGARVYLVRARVGRDHAACFARMLARVATLIATDDPDVIAATLLATDALDAEVRAERAMGWSGRAVAWRT